MGFGLSIKGVPRSIGKIVRPGGGPHLTVCRVFCYGVAIIGLSLVCLCDQDIHLLFEGGLMA